MKTMKQYLSMAALALVGAMMTGCSSDEDFSNPQQPENKNNLVTLTTTVGFDDAAGTTRALSSTGVKTFAAGETMAVIYYNGTSTVKAVSHALEAGDITNEGKNATFTFDLETPKKSGSVLYIYPAAMADDTGVDVTKLNTQEGTFDALQSKYDLCTNFGDWDGDNLPSLTLNNLLAILAINLKNGSTDITSSITGLTVGDGTNTYTVNRSAAAGPIYVAILPTSGATINVTATDGSKNYTKSLTNKTYDASQGYNVSWRMTEVAVRDLSMLDCAGNLRPRSTANCYMVHTAGDYKLPLVYGNAIKNGATNAAAYTGIDNTNTTLTFPRHDGNAITAPWIKDNSITVTQAELLWQDAQGLITAVGIDGDYLTLTVGKNAAAQEGNAVVAAKDGEGNIVWSWHIWVTKQTFAAADLTTVATGSHNYTVTPVNLGWVSTSADGKQGYNTYYQWGRKDAFKGTGAPADANVYNISNATVTGLTYVQDNNNTITIADNIKNPTTFYQVTHKPSNTTYYNMWDAQQTGSGNITTATKKTVYDPSPAGFCVPTDNLYYYFGNGNNRSMSTWDSTNKGATWNLGITGNALFFPASGYRANSNGGLTVVGSQGYCWSATVGGSSINHARSFWFDSSNWNWGYGARSSAFSVRAVAEE